MDKELYDVIILGSGPAGLTAAIYAGRGKLTALVIGGATWGGQLMLTSERARHIGSRLNGKHANASRTIRC